MIEKALEQIKSLTEKYECSGLYHNIEVTTDVVRKNKDAREAEILSVALSFLLDYAIDRRNTDLIHEIYDMAERADALKELQSSKAYEIMYRLEDETLNIYPRGIGELVSFMEGLDNTHTEYDVMPYDSKSRYKFE